MENFDDKYKKKNPFTVPEGYFDGLTDRVVKRLEDQKRSEKTKLFRIVRPYLGLVGVFVLALLVIQAIFPLITDRNRQLVKENSEMAQMPAETPEEDIFDSQFNPTSEEIIEYLASEMNNYELMYAEIY